MASVLIMEDDFDLSDRWREALILRGHSVDLSFTARDALARIEQGAYDVFIVDLLVRAADDGPTDGGTRLMQKLWHHRRDDVRSAVKIGVSGFAPRMYPDAAEELFRGMGAAGFLAKPFRADDLVDEMERLLGARGSGAG